MYVAPFAMDKTARTHTAPGSGASCLTDEMRERLPDLREGRTLSFSIQTVNDEKLVTVKGYVTTGMYPDGRLGEIFVRIGKPGSSDGMYDQWAIAFSVALQFGADVDAVCQKFVHTSFEPAGVTNVPGVRRCSSIPDLICRWLLLHYGKKEPVAGEGSRL